METKQIKTAGLELNEELAGHILATHSPRELAQIIRADWKPSIYFGAVPYLDAMNTMESFKQQFGCDDGDSIGLYFLSNAKTWRGDVAKLVKRRIKELTK